MSWNDFVYGLGDLLTASFEVLPALGNLPNILFTLLIMGGFVYWLLELKKYRQKAKQSGGVE